MHKLIFSGDVQKLSRTAGAPPANGGSSTFDWSSKLQDWTANKAGSGAPDTANAPSGNTAGWGGKDGGGGGQSGGQSGPPAQDGGSGAGSWQSGQSSQASQTAANSASGGDKYYPI